MGVREPVAMEIPLEEGAAARVPPRIRRRLLEGRTGGGGGGQPSAEEIEARLKEAEQRRQQFYDWFVLQSKEEATEARRGHLKRRITDSALKPSFGQLSRKG
ncbi:hypothetical protein ACQ4PT_029827 [Festuca glaucescens]